MSGRICNLRFAICDWRPIAVAFTLLAAGCAGVPQQANEQSDARAALSPSTTNPSESSWPQVSKILGRPGELKDGVYTITVPREDLDVRIEGMEVPTGAGLASVFWFYQCSCGRTSLVGQFVTADYEANDVIDALRAGQMKVASLSPLLLYEKPKLLLIRFQAEGDPAAMAKTLHEALRWTGKERMAPQKMAE